MERLQLQFPQEYEKRCQFSTLYYFIDPAGPPFDDRRVRQALAMAINRAALADVIKRRYATLRTAALSPRAIPAMFRTAACRSTRCVPGSCWPTTVSRSATIFQ